MVKYYLFMSRSIVSLFFVQPHIMAKEFSNGGPIPFWLQSTLEGDVVSHSYLSIFVVLSFNSFRERLCQGRNVRPINHFFARQTKIRIRRISVTSKQFFIITIKALCSSSRMKRRKKVRTNPVCLIVREILRSQSSLTYAAAIVI